MAPFGNMEQVIKYLGTDLFKGQKVKTLVPGDKPGEIRAAFLKTGEAGYVDLSGET